MAAATNTAAAVAAATLTVCSKLPFDFAAEHGGKTVVFKGGKAIDPVTREPYLTGGYGLTRDVDADWFAAWSDAVGDFKPLQTGAIFSSTSKDPEAEAAEMNGEVATGLEQKSAEELGVEVVADDKK
ncbi:hypothetical protein [Novosphingobium resinovorum]|uniref:Uncharacterized protein n=1 Tax=Novosphingobium resinovorum TaxID=158500 RepID=A0A1D8A2P0_9SPHN|nr:hypothetical protein [Novosphingobium resinovorum]AOR76336.1 hypothetical protein BES08_05850 [Novosphingobium resinovorum]